MTDDLTRLTELLRELPGIGPRQARRLTFWFAGKDSAWVHEFSRTLVAARSRVRHCAVCMRTYPFEEKNTTTCALCTDERRDSKTLMIIERDVDLENIERTHAYRGRYFVLGGTSTGLDKHRDTKIFLAKLIERIRAGIVEKPCLEEVILALSTTPDGEDTATYVVERLEHAFGGAVPCRITMLGRGLSTGTELEYVDTETMKNALSSRH